MWGPLLVVGLAGSAAQEPRTGELLDADRETPGFSSFYPGGGGYAGLVYNVAYARAMLQAALSSSSYSARSA